MILSRFIILIQTTASDRSSCVCLHVFTLLLHVVEIIVVIIVHFMVSSYRVGRNLALTFILRFILLVVVMVGAIVAVVGLLAVSLISSVLILRILILNPLILVSLPITLVLFFATATFTTLHARLLHLVFVGAGVGGCA